MTHPTDPPRSENGYLRSELETLLRKFRIQEHDARLEIVEAELSIKVIERELATLPVGKGSS